MHSTDHLLDDLHAKRSSIAVIGLGYVGLPLALCLAKHFRVVGLDRDQRKITALRAGRDPVGESGDAAVAARVADGSFTATDDAGALRACRFVIVAVPTPVDSAKRPDFAPLISASTTIGRNLAPGAVVVYESTVYPGATEEICIPVVARESGRTSGVDFAYGYSHGYGYGVELVALEPLPSCDAIIAAVAHRQFKALRPATLAAACPGGPLLDVKAAFDRAAVLAAGLELWRL